MLANVLPAISCVLAVPSRQYTKLRTKSDGTMAVGRPCQQSDRLDCHTMAVAVHGPDVATKVFQRCSLLANPE